MEQRVNKAFSTSEKKLFEHYNTCELICSHPLALCLKEENNTKRAFDDTKQHECEKCPHWWTDICRNMQLEIDLSNKMKLLFEIFNQMSKDDKILVFTQRIQTLDAIEYFMSKTINAHTGQVWKNGEDFVRIDGKTKFRGNNITKFKTCTETR